MDGVDGDVQRILLAGQRRTTDWGYLKTLTGALDAAVRLKDEIFCEEVTGSRVIGMLVA